MIRIKSNKSSRTQMKWSVLVSLMLVAVSSISINSIPTDAAFTTNRYVLSQISSHQWFPTVSGWANNSKTITLAVVTPGYTKHTLQYSTTSTFTSQTTVTLTAASWTLSTATPNTTYYFRAMATDHPAKAWSDVISIKTPA